MLRIVDHNRQNKSKGTPRLRLEFILKIKIALDLFNKRFTYLLFKKVFQAENVVSKGHFMVVADLVYVDMPLHLRSFKWNYI